MPKYTLALALILVGFSRPAQTADLLAPFTSPPKFQVIKTEKVEGVELSEIFIESVEGTAEGEERPTKVFALMARPAGTTKKKYPAILLCHGAGLSVLREKVIGWAQLGYVAISPEFAAYVNRDGARSEARFIGTDSVSMFTVDPNPRASLLYDSIQTGLASFELLRTQVDVDSKRVGISGVSWGGVMALELAGILEDRVAAVASLYGTAYFLKNMQGLGGQLSYYMPDKSKMDAWISAFDPANYLAKIKAPVFLQAATNDQFFSPAAAYSTLKSIVSPTFLCFGPNKSHWLNVPGGTKTWTGPTWTDMEIVFFHRAFEGANPIFPTVSGSAADRTFSVDPAVKGAEGFVYYTTNINGDRSAQAWNKLSVTQERSGMFSAKGWPNEDFIWFGGISFPARSEDGGGFVTLTTPIFYSRGPLSLDGTSK